MDNRLLNKNMIEGQIKPIGGMQNNILEAFDSIDRDDFIPQDLKHNSYIEKNLFVKNDRFVLKANLIAKIILALNVSNEENVLVIGSSTGYSSAIISKLAETVISIEEDKELLAFSEDAVSQTFRLPEFCSVSKTVLASVEYLPISVSKSTVLVGSNGSMSS
ncbi:uncharacterized protein METZ01_LOCUS140496, partial [marine metagenome]